MGWVFGGVVFGHCSCSFQFCLSVWVGLLGNPHRELPQIVAQHGENDPQVNNPPGDDQIVPHGTVPIQNNVGNGLPDQANLQQNALQNEWFGGAATEWWVVCWYC